MNLSGYQIVLENTKLYKRFLEEREEILKHKWIESEKEGRDIGFEKALLDWVMNYRNNWVKDKKD